MMTRVTLLFLIILATSACDTESGASSPSSQASISDTSAGATSAPYVGLDEDLTHLINDFNEAVGKVRQIYIIGPSCGICLRGMADMDDALVSEAQSDPRLQTLVLHVPALGAEERDVEPTIHLLNGPRVRHYWDGSGHSGLEFQKALDLPVYAWDVWLVYGPDVRWESGNPPPAPEFWQHQLGYLGDYGSKLNPEVLAQEVRTRMDKIDLQSVAQVEARSEPTDDDSATLIRVEQPRGYVIQQHLTTRGGYHNLKNIRSITAKGILDVDGKSLPLTLVTRNDDSYERQVGGEQHASRTMVESGIPQREGNALIPPGIEDPVLIAQEFDSWFMEWKDKGHQVWRLGMIREDGRLPWLMEVEHRNGQTWNVYIDSHTGDDYRHVLLDDEGQAWITIDYGDFKSVGEFRFPHSWSISTSQGLVAKTRISFIHIAMEEDGDLDVSH